MKRLALSVAALGLLGAGLPTAGPVSASSPVAEEPGFSGYSSRAWAAPVRIEIYDPAIPIPSSPQIEVEFGYSMVEADSGSSHGRASWLWPGDPVGEGLKTFVEQTGLPPKLGEKGYPAQVNAIAPGGPAEHKDEPLPGTIMRTTASDTGATASTGFSPDGESQDSEETPESPLGGLLGLLGVQPAPGEPPASAPGIPAPLEALVDFGGYQSSSRNSADGASVQASSRSALGEVRLLGGLIKMSGISARSVASSDGSKGVATGRSTYGSMTIAGKEFSIGPDGVVAAGKPGPLPGLPDDPAAALAKLGLKIVVPKTRLTREGDKAVSVAEGLRIELNTEILRPVLSALPLDKLVALFPDLPGQASQLKSVLSGVTSLAPRFVITLGVATSTVDTVQAVPVEPAPTLPEPAAPDLPGVDTGTGAAPAVAPPVVEPPAEAGPGDLDGAVPVSAGLPPLFSIPGVLFLGALVLAVAVGSYLRKMGALALGAGTCSHGLDSGLPDLRKA